VTTSGTSRRACIRVDERAQARRPVLDALARLLLSRHRCGRLRLAAWTDLRRALAVALAIALPAAVHAQPKPTLPTIGVLMFNAAPDGTNPTEENSFRDGLRALGYEEGRNILIERRYADGRTDRLAR
jgi:hypothetical protein